MKPKEYLIIMERLKKLKMMMEIGLDHFVFG